MAAQIDALSDSGCRTILRDDRKQPGSVRRIALGQANDGATIMCLDLYHLGRTIEDVISFIAKAGARGAIVIELRSGFATSTDASRTAIDRLNAAVSAFHRERTQDALAKARQNGVRLGRHPKIDDKHWPAIQAKILKGATIREIALDYSTSRQTVYKFIKRMEQSSSRHIPRHQATKPVPTQEPDTAEKA